MVRCSNKECPRYNECQRPLDFDENHIKMKAKYNYENNEAKGTPCFIPRRDK